jgi:ankyrin repeat protein
MSNPPALFETVVEGNVGRLADLLSAGANPNVFFQSRYGISVGLTPLQLAVWKIADEPGGPIDALVLLLRHGADANARHEGHATTALLNATRINSLEAARVLLAAGADPNASDEEGHTPLILCAEEGYLNLARLLLHCGAVKSINAWGGPSSLTALGYAARELHVDMVRLLLAHGADAQECDLDHLTALDCLEYAALPDDPANQERIREIRRLLGAPEPTVATSRHTGQKT